MIYSAKTDVGLTRTANQDAFSVNIFNEDFALFVVCDGMGGTAAGNVASEMAVERVVKSFNDNYSPKLSEKQIVGLLKSSVESANAAIYEKASANEELKGMGTTIVCAVVYKNTCLVAHAGDSRLYRFRQGVLSQITTDHSVVQTMVDSGHITEEEAKIHPNKNIITRALGVHSAVEVDITDFSLESNDIVLLCSDGLTNCLESDEIANILHSADFEKVTDIMIEKANGNGGYDNITAVAFKI